MWVAKIFMLGELKDYKSYVTEVIKMIELSAKIANNWKREEFLFLDNAEDMFYDFVLDCQGFLMSKNDPALLNDIIRISEAMLKSYPAHIQSILNISTVFVAQGKWDNAIDLLSKAIVIDPKNAVIYFNKAYVYLQKGDRANAKKYYELTVTHCRDSEEALKQRAQERLNMIK
jgi:tetratricopeptide (TPR) repeat protein